MKDSWSRRERMLLLGVVALGVIAGADHWYRALAARRQALEWQRQELHSQLEQLAEVPTATVKPAVPTDPMALLMAPPGLRLTHLNMEPNPAHNGLVSLEAEGGYHEFIAYLERLAEKIGRASCRERV
jgi:hypothetical protein